MSFLDTALKKVESASAIVPPELLDGWKDADDTVSAACLLHPSVRGVDGDETATEQDVRDVLSKKQFEMTRRVSTSEFMKLASRVRKRASSRRR